MNNSNEICSVMTRDNFDKAIDKLKDWINNPMYDPEPIYMNQEDSEKLIKLFETK